MRKKNTIYVIPHSHYDVVWAFNKEDYYYINELILTQVIDMIKKHDFRFLIEQIYLLELIEERNPVLFQEIHKAIKHNKIEIADGQYTMADTMIPIGEILVREILVGKLYCKEKFGKDVPVAWAADGFGLNSQMPQIYKKSGYKWLAFRRGLPKSIGYRVSEFIWEGLDFTKIISHWMPAGYRAGLELDKWEQSYKNLTKYATTRNILMPCGSGGVPPQEDTPEKVEEWNERHNDSRMVISLPSDFFKGLEKDASGLAEYHGELYSQELENVFPDVVSSRISLKLAYKECENLLISAEKLSTIAYMQGHKYPVDILKKLWKNMLFLVNHDVIAGCGIDEIYDEAWEKIAEIKLQAHNLIRESLFYLSKTRDKGNSILVYNPNNWEVTSWQEVDLELDTGIGKNIGIAVNNKEIPGEILEIEDSKDGEKLKVKMGFIATVPPLGYRKYHVVKKKNHFASTVKIRGHKVENKYFKISVDDKTGIITVFDRENDRKLVEGNEIIIDQEIGDLYFHKSQYDEPIESENGEGIHFSTFVPGECTIHKGPVRTVIDFTNSFYCVQWPYYLTSKFGSILQRHKTIEVRKKVFIYNDERRIDFQTTILSSQSHIRIRIRFDNCMVVPKYSRQTQFGVIDIPLAKSLEESIRFPSLNWLHCQDRTRGVAFFTRGVPINEVKAGNIYYTLLRSVSVLSTDGASGPLIPTPKAMELGEHTYSYAIYPHNGNWKQSYIQRRGHEYNHQMISTQADSSDLYAELGSFIIKPSNLVVSSLKKAEKDDTIILRFFETKGDKCTADITFPSYVKSIAVVNMLEEDEQKLDGFKNHRLKLDVGPFEIVTLKLFPANRK
jgi:alpha-mannosidase